MPKMSFSFCFKVQSMEATEASHPFAEHHQLRAFVMGDWDEIVVRVQGEEFDVTVLPRFFGDGLGGVVFFHSEAAAIFGVAHGVEMDEDDAALAGA